ncbi:MAG TPA: DUF362 domain-containing protein [Polyangiaceae bacterium]|jgi:hypothetical protein|nr:DUF362 domain-containing protein [Polyangiaceae bacterium]
MHERKTESPNVSRREVLKVASAGVAASALTKTASAEAADNIDSLIAKPPAGFKPLSIPGKIVKVSAKGEFASYMQPNQLWPKPEVANAMLEKAMTEYTGASSLSEALGKFIHKDDVVAVKVNGIAGRNGYTMATNFELILPLVKGLLALGVLPEKITVYEQYPTFLAGTRVNVQNWKLPDGVKTGTHNNNDHPMPDIRVYQGIKTRYCRFLTESTAVINLTMIKDHSIAGYTGTMKNMTHGNVNNPQAHHDHNASPQIAMLYNHPIVTSRVRLHITDAFKIIYDKGPLDKDPKTRIPHGAVYVSTDPVAMDTYGWKVIDDERKARGLPSLKDSGREPAYIRAAGNFGLGVHDLNAINVSSFEV